MNLRHRLVLSDCMQRAHNQIADRADRDVFVGAAVIAALLFVLVLAGVVQ